MSDQKTIKFVEDVKVFDENGAIAFSANAGDSMELHNSSADRWIRRGKAEESAPVKKPAKKAAKKKQEK